MINHRGCSSAAAGTRRLHAPSDLPAARRLTTIASGQEYVVSKPDTSIRVLVAGDHACLRNSLKTMLELDPRIRVIGEASDDCETVKMASKLRPDVVLIDLDMRCCADFDALAEITQRNLANAVVALTIHNDEAERAAIMAAGVNVILEKGIPYKQLINAIRLAATAHKQKP